MIESRCGLLCSKCSFREQTGCKGCAQMDKPFWADACPVKSCCETKTHEHCGECENFSCALLNDFAYDKVNGKGDGERIQQCKRWREEG